MSRVQGGDNNNYYIWLINTLHLLGQYRIINKLENEEEKMKRKCFEDKITTCIVTRIVCAKAIAIHCM